MTRLSLPRLLGLAAALLSCGSPSPEVPARPAAGPPIAASALPAPFEAPIASSSTAAPALPPRPAALAFLSDGLEAPRRVKIPGNSPGRAKRGGETLGLSWPGKDLIELPVVEEAEDAVRVLVEREEFRVLVWVERALLAQVATESVMLRTAPEADAPGSGVTVHPGCPLETVERRDGAVKVRGDQAIDEGYQMGQVSFEGWIDASALGAIHQPRPLEPPSGTHHVLLEPVVFLVSPRETLQSATVGTSHDYKVLLDVYGTLTPGAFYQAITLQGPTFDVQGHVPRNKLFRVPDTRQPPSIMVSFGGSKTRQPEERLLALPAGACLYDDRGGEPVAVLRRPQCLYGESRGEGAFRVRLPGLIDAAGYARAVDATLVADGCPRSPESSPIELPRESFRCPPPPH
ncbi:MAG: hypothetical protein R3B72_06555 [Polyangiaceae bacterium]